MSDQAPMGGRETTPNGQPVQPSPSSQVPPPREHAGPQAEAEAEAAADHGMPAEAETADIPEVPDVLDVPAVADVPDPRQPPTEPTAAQAGDSGPGLRTALEAILMVVDEPVPEITLAQILERPRAEVDAALRELAAEYTAQGRGFDLREVAGGWRFYTRAECAALVERFVQDGQQTRLTQAALETLSVVAYRQPVSRARVSAIRGVNSDGVIRTLTLRGLIEEAGQDPEHQAILYRTTGYFLERLGLRSLEELPDLAPFLPDDITELEEQER
jgi:segregation and condensation protein B